MAGVLLSTANVPRYRQFAYWQDLICDTLVGLDCTGAERHQFAGSFYNQTLAGLQLSTMVSDQMHLHRSKSRIARARESEFLIALEGNVQSFGSQDGREAVLERTDFALFDSTRPYEVGFRPGFKHLILKIPRSALVSRIGQPHLMTCNRIRGDQGSGRLASRFFCDLQQELDGLDPTEANRLAEVGLDLVATALASGVPAAGLEDRAVRTARLVKIKLLINEKLPDPRLSPAMVATALGISVRYLNALFSSEPLSLERWIWERRLQRCHAALEDPSQQGRSISDIAYSWGFSEMSHFSRTFKQRFCCSPREMRRKAASQRPAGGGLRRVKATREAG